MGFNDLKRLSSKYESGSREEGEDRNRGRRGGSDIRDNTRHA